MTEPWTMTAPAPPPATARPETRADLRLAGIVIGALAVAGALLGIVWSQWSGPQQRAYVIAPGKLYPFDEVETRVGADGRYLVVVAAAGLAAALLAWFVASARRGVLVAAALAAGGAAGAALTWWVGYLTGGGTYDGKPGTMIAHLPLTLHMTGLIAVEPAAAVLVYGLFVAFAARDDLGRPDPVRDRLSVRPGGDPQDGWGYGDAPRPLEQGDLPPQ